MIGSVSARYYQPKMAVDVHAYVKQYQMCQACKFVTRNSQGYIRPLPVPKHYWQQVMIDLIICLPKIEWGVNAIAIFMDHLSQYTYFVPISTTISMDELAEVFLATVVARHGMPERLISDHDSHFVSAFQKGLMVALGAHIALSTAYHLQTDRQSERQHHSLEQILRCYVSPRQHDWDLLLPCPEFALNTTHSSMIGYTPTYTLYGHDPNFPLEEAVRKVTDCCVASILEWVDHMLDKVQYVGSALAVTSQNMEQQENHHHHDSEINVGSKAWLSTKCLCLLPGLTRKFAPQFVGPFKVLAAITPVSFQLQLPEAWSIHSVFHVSQLKAAVGDATIDLPSNSVYSLPLDESGEYEAENILDMCMSRSGVCEFQVLSKGYSLFESTWEPEHHLENTPTIVAIFCARHGLSLRAMPLSKGGGDGRFVSKYL